MFGPQFIKLSLAIDIRNASKSTELGLVGTCSMESL